MSKIVFKQSYKSRSDSSTPGLNVRHLNYIATRPGAVYNPGCGFGLWGRLPIDDSIRIQYDLELAKRTVREASQDHTLYRAIVSVGKDDAQNHGLYSRERWEQLVNNKIGVIAKEMDIKQENLCWCASMHYTKNHPHVHILYWDNGTDPRLESMPKDDFIKKAERIRAEFSREIHQEEIQEVQKEQQTQLKEFRTAVQAMCREANPEQSLDLPKLYRGDKLEGLSRHMFELIRDMPAKGSLRYAYLPPQYKEKLNRLIRESLEVPELAKELTRYEAFTRQISQLYSNGKEGTEENLKKALEKLYIALGNQVMAAIKEIRSEIQLSHPSDSQEVRELIQAAVTEVVPNLDSYQQLKQLLPVERIPVKCMEQQIPAYHDQMNKVIGDVMLDARIRLRLQSYALEQALPTDRIEPEKSEHTVCGHKLTDEEWDAYQEVYRDVKRELRREITQQLRQEVGWTDEAVRTGTASMLCGMMRLLSQSASQRQAGTAQARQNQKLRSKDKSREAKKEQQAIQSNGGEWETEY